MSSSRSDPPLQREHNLLPAVGVAAGRLLLRHAHLHAALLQRNEAAEADPVRRPQTVGSGPLCAGVGLRQPRVFAGAPPLSPQAQQQQRGCLPRLRCRPRPRQPRSGGGLCLPVQTDAPEVKVRGHAGQQRVKLQSAADGEQPKGGGDAR